jgi:predicted dehydrogenase
MTYQREFERRVRIGVVGVGSHSYRNILSVLTYLPVDLVAIADVNAELGLVTARQYGLDRCYASAGEMYANEQLDAVLLVVSAQLHPALAIEAFEAGLHVWMEKPAAATVADVDSMIAARHGLIASVGYKKAFMPATTKLLEVIESGALTPLRTILGQYPMSIPRGDEAFIARKEGSQWLANGCHPLSFLLTIGGPVSALTVHRGVEDSGILMLRHANGVISNLHLALGAPSSQPFERYSIFGGNSSVEIENTRKLTFQRGIEFSYGRSTTFAPPGFDSGALVWEAQDGLNTLENKPEFTQGLYGGLLNFLESVLSETPPARANLEMAREIATIYEAAILSDGIEVPLHPSTS